MPVLKQHHSTPAMRDAIVLDLGDIGAQATRIRAAAETQAAGIIAKAQAKAEEIARSRGEEAEHRGYEEGLQRGLAEGQEQGRNQALAESAEQLRQLTAAWSQVATDWEQQRTAMERDARQAVLDFALRATEKIVHRVIEIDESVVVDQAAQALSMVLSAHNASVRIHPVDRPMLEDAVPSLLQELATLQHIELVDDEEITPGGCMVAFGQGKVDATIERQLQRLVDLILPEPVIDDTEDEQEPPAEDDAQDATGSQGSVKTQPMPEARGGTTAPVYEITDRGLVESDGQSQAFDDEEEDPPAFDPELDADGDGPELGA